MTAGLGEERVLGPNLGLWVGRGVKTNRWGVQGGWAGLGELSLVIPDGTLVQYTLHTLYNTHIVQLILAGRRPEFDF